MRSRIAVCAEFEYLRGKTKSEHKAIAKEKLEKTDDDY